MTEVRILGKKNSRKTDDIIIKELLGEKFKVGNGRRNAFTGDAGKKNWPFPVQIH